MSAHENIFSRENQGPPPEKKSVDRPASEMQKGSLIEEGHLMSDHVHMMISIPPKFSVAQVVGFIKGKSAIHIARNYAERSGNFSGQHFWARGYFVSTVGRDESVIREYIRQQEIEDQRLDQLNLPLKKTGVRCHSARDLVAEGDLDLMEDTGEGLMLMDNHEPFGPDLFARFEGPPILANTWDSSVLEYHAYGKGKVRGVVWTVTGDPVEFFLINGSTELEFEGEFTLPVKEMQVFPPFGEMGQIAFSSNIVIAAAE